MLLISMEYGQSELILLQRIHSRTDKCRNIIYTSLFNMIDYPAMVIPVNSSVDPKLDPIDQNYKPANAKDAEIQAQCKPKRL